MKSYEIISQLLKWYYVSCNPLIPHKIFICTIKYLFEFIPVAAFEITMPVKPIHSDIINLVLWSSILPGSLDTQMTFRWVSLSTPHEDPSTEQRVTKAECGHHSLIGGREKIVFQKTWSPLVNCDNMLLKCQDFIGVEYLSGHFWLILTSDLPQMRIPMEFTLLDFGLAWDPASLSSFWFTP